jgi:hypothetical protein
MNVGAIDAVQLDLLIYTAGLEPCLDDTPARPRLGREGLAEHYRSVVSRVRERVSGAFPLPQPCRISSPLGLARSRPMPSRAS